MRKDPVESRVAILAADPPCNITHVHLPRAFPRRVPCCGFPFSMTEHVSRYRQEWFGGVRAARADILAGIVVALALIPEAIGFSLIRSEEHTSELQSLMRIPYSVFCWQNKKHNQGQHLL